MRIHTLRIGACVAVACAAIAFPTLTGLLSRPAAARSATSATDSPAAALPDQRWETLNPTLVLPRRYDRDGYPIDPSASDSAARASGEDTSQPDAEAANPPATSDASGDDLAAESDAPANDVDGPNGTASSADDSSGTAGDARDYQKRTDAPKVEMVPVPYYVPVPRPPVVIYRYYYYRPRWVRPYGYLRPLPHPIPPNVRLGNFPPPGYPFIRASPMRPMGLRGRLMPTVPAPMRRFPLR